MNDHGDIRGCQFPSISVVQEGFTNDFEDAVSLARSYGLMADPWQGRVLQSWLAVRRNGLWASPTCGLAVARQNGKNACLEIRELFGLVILGERILHSAHRVSTARKAFIRLKSFFENKRDYPELFELVSAIRQTNGQEAIVLKNGAIIEFCARQKNTALGFTVDLLICDESQDLSQTSWEALLPTISATPNAQTIMTGTPPKPDQDGEIFVKARRDALVEGATLQSWMEWSVDEDADLDDPVQWAKANPSLGIRISLEAIQKERRQMKPEGFARERGGRFIEVVGKPPVIDMLAWGVLADKGIEPVPGGVLAWDVAPMGLGCAISYAWFNEDGKPCVKLMAADDERANDLPVVRDQLKSLWSPKIEAYDVYNATWGGGNYAALSVGQKRRVWQTGAREMVQACAGLLQAIASQEFRHPGQERLDDSAGSATKRDVGADGGWAFNRRSMDAELPPIVSATLALYVLKKSKKTTSGSARIIVLT